MGAGKMTQQRRKLCTGGSLLAIPAQEEQETLLQFFLFFVFFKKEKSRKTLKVNLWPPHTQEDNHRVQRMLGKPAPGGQTSVIKLGLE